MKQNQSVGTLKIRDLLLLISFTFFLILCVLNWSTIFSAIQTVLSVLTPFILGFAMAYLFNLPMNYFERHLPLKITKYRRGISALLSAFFVVGFLVFVISIVGPQLLTSVITLSEALPGYLETATEWLTDMVELLGISNAVFSQLLLSFETFQQEIFTYLQTYLPQIISFAGSFTVGIANTFVSLVIGLYLVASKETLIPQWKKLCTAFLPQKYNDYVMMIGQLTNRCFASFISGQMIESIIVGVLCTIGCIILDIPYAPLLGVIVGVTNIIPIFGPIFGTIPGAFIVLIIDPFKALIFVLFVVVLQQVESNLIYPRVVGTSIGLSPIWILFAVTFGGGLFGILGIILGIPTVAVFYQLISGVVKKKLKDRTTIEIESEEAI